MDRELERRLRTGLAEAHDEILQNEEEIRGLKVAAAAAVEARSAIEAELRQREAERDHLQGELTEARRELGSLADQALRLRVRLERLESSPPLRAWAKLRELPGFRSVVARRTAAYERDLSGARSTRPPDD